MTVRRWCLGWVLFALVCAQGLAFMHRVVHVPGARAETPAPAAWTVALFGAHDDSSCRLLDASGTCAPPAPPPSVALPPLPAVELPPFLYASFVEVRGAPFEARAPPVSR